MTEKFTFIDLFAGIGGIRLGFEAVGGKCVFSSEWDKSAQTTYQLNFHEMPAGDITKIPSEEIPDHDILLGGFPCQPFSIIGDGRGFADTRGTLFFEIERIIRDKHPQAFMLENVRRLVTHDKHRTFSVILEHLNKLGYFVHWKILNTLDFGLPQKREKVYIIGFKENYKFDFPYKGLDKAQTLSNILEPEEMVDKSFFASEQIVRKRLDFVKGKKIPYPSIWHENKGGNISPLPFSCALRAGASFNYLLVNGQRRLTYREQLRLQGFPDSFQIFGSDSEIKRQTGNSVSVPVVKAIATQMIQSLFGFSQNISKKSRISFVTHQLDLL